MQLLEPKSTDPEPEMVTCSGSAFDRVMDSVSVTFAVLASIVCEYADRRSFAADWCFSEAPTEFAERTTANVADPANVPLNRIRHRGGRRIGLGNSVRHRLHCSTFH